VLVKLMGWPGVITGYDWIVSKATHKLDGNGGYATSLELENKSTAIDHTTLYENDAISQAKG